MSAFWGPRGGALSLRQAQGSHSNAACYLGAPYVLLSTGTAFSPRPSNCKQVKSRKGSFPCLSPCRPGRGHAGLRAAHRSSGRGVSNHAALSWVL